MFSRMKSHREISANLKNTKQFAAQRWNSAVSKATESLERRLLFASISSTSSGGDFNATSTWVGGVVPASADTATIVAGAHVTVMQGDSVEMLVTQAGSDLSINAPTGQNPSFSIENQAAGDASAIAGTLEIGVGTNFVINGTIAPVILSGNSTLSGTLEGQALTNTGTMSVTGTAAGLYGGNLDNKGTVNIGSGDIFLGAGSIITNDTTGVWNLPNDTGFAPTTYPVTEGGTFINKGTFNKTGGTGTSYFSDSPADETLNYSTFENIGGTININSGTFNVNGTADVAGGTINVAAGAVFEFDDPTTQLYTPAIGLTGTITGSGAGSVLFTQGDYAPHDQTNTGAAATLNFPAGLLTLGNVAIDAYGSNIIDNTGFMKFDSAVQTGGVNLVNNGTIQNAGAGDIVFTNVTNDNTGLIDLQTDGGLFSGTVNAPQNLINMGTLRKSGGTGVSNINANIRNEGGTIDVESGTINFDAASINYYLGGTNTVAAGANIDISQGTFVLGGTFSSTGTGTVTLSGGSLRGRNDTTGATEGTEPGVLDFAPGTFIVSGGSIIGSNEALTNTGSITFTTSINFGNFNNSGTVIANGGTQYFFNGLITNLPTGIFEFDTAASIGQDGVFVNQGKFLMAATGTIDLSVFDVADNIGTEGFQNSGTIEATSGVLIMPSDIFSAGSDGNLDVQAGAVVEAISGGVITLVPSWDDSATTITTVDGTAIIGGSGTPIPALASLATVNGTFQVDAGTIFATAGSLTNTGTVLTIGKLTVNGNLTETGSAANTEFGVSGPPSGGTPLLTVTGSTSLSGNLVAGVAGGYAATAGSAYTVTSFASPSTGSFASTSGTGPAFTATVTPASIVLNGTGNNAGGTIGGNGGGGSGGGGGASGGTPDLAVTSVTGPSSGVPGGIVLVDFTVTNMGTGSATGTWNDSIFLTQDGAIDNNSILLTRSPDGRTLAAGASYTESIGIILPVIPAGSYQFVAEADSSLAVPDSNRANNVGLSTALNLSFASLTLGQTTSGSINYDQGMLYSLLLPAGADVSIAATYAVGTEADLYVSYGKLPTTSSFDESLPASSATAGSLLIPVHQAGNYYVLVEGNAGADASAFTLTPTQIGFGILSITPSDIPEFSGLLTTTISGSGFTAASTLTLVSGSTVITPNSLEFINSNTLSASFYFDANPGTFNVVVKNGSQTSTIPNGFTVGTGSGDGSNLTYNIVLPADSRGDLNGTAYLEYSNTGYLDVPAPYFVVTAPNTKFELPGQTSFSDDAIEALGIASTGLPGTLAPGQSGVIPITYTQEQIVSHQDVDFQVVAVETVSGFDLSTLKTDLQPTNEPNDAWDAVWANFTNIANANANGFTGTLRDAANALSLRGIRAYDIPTLMNYAIQAAGDFGAITQRYELTAFGRGQEDPYAPTATADANGNVIISSGGAELVYFKQANGTYDPTGDDNGQLSLSGGTYTLVDNHLTTAFNTDGSLNYFADANGNRLTAANGAFGPNTLTSSDGDVYSFTYNASGRVTQYTDPEGRATTYTYDSTNQELLSETTPLGTTQFTYYSGTDLAELYAITSVTFPNGTSKNYNYDAQGRLISQSNGDGTQMTTYAYSALNTGFEFGVSGTVTATDALGNVTTSTLADGQGVSSVTDALDNVATSTTDANGRNTSSITSGGFATNIGYDANGNISSLTDSLGNVIHFGYDPTLNSLLTLTDPNGNQTSFTYDANGNLTGTTNPAGNTTSISYDSSGNATGSTSAAGRTIAVAYNAAHLVTSRTYSDGSTVTYTYDVHRNLLSAADSLNGTTSFTYDAADRLTSVTEPSGLSLSYKYNSNGQLIQKEDQTGAQTNYTYNSDAQLTQLSNSAGSVLVTYTYDANGNLIKAVNLNGTFTSYTYDARGEIIKLINSAPGGVVDSSFAYTYNANGQQSSVTTTSGTTTYSYDADGQLTKVSLPGGRTIVYAYDADGNRITVADSSVASVTYSVNNLNEYVTVGATTYTYDNDGNLLASTGSSGTTTYTYNDRGQLGSETSAGNTYVFHYDAFGNRSGVTLDGVATNYLIDPTGDSSVAGTFDASGHLISEYVYGLGLVGSIAANSTPSFYAFDGSGNTADTTDNIGNVTSRYSYLPFGEVLSSSGTANLFTFSGQFGVENTGDGTYFMRTRTYSASLGRFVEKDPSSYAGGDVNLYRYSTNDPVNNADPTGQDGFLLGAAGAALRTVGQAVVNPSGLGTNALFSLVRTGGISALTPVAEVAAETAITTTAVTFTNAAVPVITPTIVYGVSTIPTSAPIYVAGAVSVPVAPFALAGAVILAPLGKTVSDNYFRTHYPDGIPVPVQNVINPDTYQKTLKKPALQSLIDDFVKDNGHEPDQDQLIFLTQYANAIDFGDPNQFIHDRVLKDTPTQYVNAHDPNSIIGPPGFGSAGFIQSGYDLPYEITFENDGSAPAKVVTITQQLDADLDWTTFQLTGLGFGSNVISVPAGLHAYTTSVVVSSTLRVDISASLNVLTGALTWTFTSIDPTTGDVPAGALDGFLPPNDAADDGDGYVSYIVKPKAGLATGATVQAQATITFDGNTPISTPNLLNTIDAVAPTSTVTALPATQNSTYFTVSWSGSDDAGGSGIAGYTILVSIDGGVLSTWLSNTTATSAVYVGQPGSTYAFESIATDNAGNVEPAPTAAESTTAVPAVARTIAFSAGHPAKFTDAAGAIVIVTLSGPGTGTLSFLSNGNADPASLVINNSTVRSSVSVHVSRGNLVLGSVTVNGSLNSFNAPHTSFVGTFTVTGSLADLVLGDEAIAASTLSIGGLVPTSIHLGIVHDLVIDDAAAIKSLTVTSWTNGPVSSDSIIAPAIAVINVIGNFDPTLTLTGASLDLRSINVRGTLSGLWTIAGSVGQISVGSTASNWMPTISGSLLGLTVRGTLAGKLSASSAVNVRAGSLSGATIALSSAATGKAYVLNSLTVAGSVVDSNIITQGSIRSVTAGSFSGSELFAGIISGQATLPTDTSAFATTASILLIRSSGKSPFANTLIAASSIGSVALANATTDNAGIIFGVATESLKAFSLLQPRQKPFIWNSKKSVALLGTLPGDLRASIL